MDHSAIDWLRGLEQFGVRLGLQRISALLDLLGAPQKEFEPVIVAGTNGKGSTAAFLSSLLSACDRRPGLYTSPHLVRVEERIRIDEREISRADLIGRLENVRAAVSSLDRSYGPPTYFEALTAAALLHFAKERVDIGIRVPPGGAAAEKRAV